MSAPSERPALPLRRISPLDASNLRVERTGLPMAVAALARVEADGLLRVASGTVTLEAVRQLVANRVAREPRLTEVLLPTRWWQGPPPWVPDPRFDVDARVRGITVPSPGDEPALLRLCCRLNGSVLDPASCPWELWVISGCADGTLGLLLRLHHVMADGADALNLLGVLFDPAPGPPTEPGVPGGRPPGIPPPDLRLPGSGDLVRDNLRRKGAGIRRTAVQLAAALRPANLARHVAVTVRMGRLLLAGGRAPALSFNRPVTAERQLTLVRADLTAARAAAHAHGATVNDLLLVAVAQGVRALLERRGELRRGLVLHVSVPTSLRAAHEVRTAGNRVAVRRMLVPLDEPDPGRQLAALAPATAKVKQLPPLQPSGALGQRWMVRIMRRQRLVNVLLSNMAGPPVPLWFGGARVRELFQIGVVQGNLSITVGALSYAGQLNIEIASDADLVPDIEVFAEGVESAVRALGCLRSEVGPVGGGAHAPKGPDR